MAITTHDTSEAVRELVLTFKSLEILAFLIIFWKASRRFLRCYRENKRKSTIYIFYMLYMIYNIFLYIYLYMFLDMFVCYTYRFDHWAICFFNCFYFVFSDNFSNFNPKWQFEPLYLQYFWLICHKWYV